MDHWLLMVHLFKNFLNTFFSRYQKFLSWDNSNGSKTTPKYFSIFFSTNMVARGVQMFCIPEGTTDPMIEQWLRLFVNLVETFDEQTLKISSQYLERRRGVRRGFEFSEVNQWSSDQWKKGYNFFDCSFLGCAAILAAAQPLKIVFVVVVVVVLLQPNQLLQFVFWRRDLKFRI